MRNGVLVLLGAVLVLGIVSCKASTGESQREDATVAEDKSDQKETENWIQDMFGEKLVKRDKEEVPTTELEDKKKIGVYFSAHWCPPCRSFTPKLVEAYNKIKEEGKPFEIVLIDFDKTKKKMFSYMNGEKMEWLALPFDGHRQELGQKFGVRGIPSLIILDEDGEVITKNGRGDIMSKGADAYEQW